MQPIVCGAVLVVRPPRPITIRLPAIRLSSVPSPHARCAIAEDMEHVCVRLAAIDTHLVLHFHFSRRWTAQTRGDATPRGGGEKKIIRTCRPTTAALPFTFILQLLQISASTSTAIHSDPSGISLPASVQVSPCRRALQPAALHVH